MAISSDKYILPPPLGQSNDLYEAYPQGPGTPNFTLPGSTIGAGGTNNGIVGSTIQPTSPNAGPPSSSLTVTPLSNNPLSAGAGVNSPASSTFPSLGDVWNGMTGNSSGGMDLLGINKAIKSLEQWASDIFNRSAVFILGAVFILLGLYMLAKEQGYSVPRFKK